jgi:H+/Cl- antiporter ClcA
VASFGLRFWWLVVLVGVSAGVGGAALLELLHAIQHAAWGYTEGTFLRGVQHASSAHRVRVLALGGVVAGVAAVTLLRRFPAPDLSESMWLRDAHVPLPGSVARALDSIVLVALGASLGREAAPQQTGAAFAGVFAERAGVPDWQRRLLVACGAGAGLAAVYNVPLGGALFALEVLLGTLTLPLVLPALASSAIAVAIAWIALGTRPTYIVPDFHLHGSLVVWAIVIGPLAGLAAIAYVRLIATAHSLRPRTRRTRLVAPIVIFTVLGVLAIPYPELLGNGKNVVQLTFAAQLGTGLVAVLLVLKPLATAGCLGSGAPGGLFTPTLCFGVLFGELLGRGWMQLWPGGALGSYAVIGGAAILGASMQGPLAAVVLLLELTHQGQPLLVPILIAVVEATVIARVAGVPSIYSARVSAPQRAQRVPGPDQGREAGASGAPSDLLPASWPAP